MKQMFLLPFFVIVFVLIIVSQETYAQNVEATIKKMDSLEAVAIQKADTTTLLAIWSKDYVVNNPFGYIVNIPQILYFIRTGQIDYSFYERDVERVTLSGNLAISMGKEIAKPKNKTPNAGKTIFMRYTHVWVNTNGVWRLIARQASEVSIK